MPVDRVFFVALTTYLRGERSTDAVADECFVVLRGPIRGQAMTEAGMRKIFRTHRARSGRDTGAAAPVAPRLRDRTGGPCTPCRSRALAMSRVDVCEP